MHEQSLKGRTYVGRSVAVPQLPTPIQQQMRQLRRLRLRKSRCKTLHQLCPWWLCEVRRICLLGSDCQTLLELRLPVFEQVFQVRRLRELKRRASLADTGHFRIVENAILHRLRHWRMVHACGFSKRRFSRGS